MEKGLNNIKYILVLNKTADGDLRFPSFFNPYSSIYIKNKIIKNKIKLLQIGKNMI